MFESLLPTDFFNSSLLKKTTKTLGWSLPYIHLQNPVLLLLKVLFYTALNYSHLALSYKGMVLYYSSSRTTEPRTEPDMSSYPEQSTTQLNNVWMLNPAAVGTVNRHKVWVQTITGFEFWPYHGLALSLWESFDFITLHFFTCKIGILIPNCFSFWKYQQKKKTYGKYSAQCRAYSRFPINTEWEHH